MNKNLSVFKSIAINASATEVWDVLTNPGNYSIITYEIEDSSNGRILLRWTQEGFASEEA